MKDVFLYVTNDCVYCRDLKKFLDQSEVAYTLFNVAEDAEAAKVMVGKSGQHGVPVVVISEGGQKEQVVIGFDRLKLSELLELS